MKKLITIEISEVINKSTLIGIKLDEENWEKINKKLQQFNKSIKNPNYKYKRHTNDIINDLYVKLNAVAPEIKLIKFENDTKQENVKCELNIEEVFIGG